MSTYLDAIGGNGGNGGKASTEASTEFLWRDKPLSFWLQADIDAERRRIAAPLEARIEALEAAAKRLDDVFTQWADVLRRLAQ